MNEKITVTGMVLSAMPIGEADKRIVLLTKERGKISAFAKGAKRQNSVLLAGSRPFSFGEFYLYEGRNSYTVHSMQISNYFTEISQNLEAAAYGMYFLELVSSYCYENEDGTEVLKFLYQSLRALLNERISDSLIQVIFELRMRVLFGSYPQMFACVNCKSAEQLTAISLQKNGAVCTACAGRVKDVKKLSPSAMYAMQYIICSPLEKLYTFQVSEEVLFELQSVMKRYMALNFDRKLHSLEVLEDMKKMF